MVEKIWGQIKFRPVDTALAYIAPVGESGFLAASLLEPLFGSSDPFENGVGLFWLC